MDKLIKVLAFLSYIFECVVNFVKPKKDKI